MEVIILKASRYSSAYTTWQSFRSLTDKRDPARSKGYRHSEGGGEILKEESSPQKAIQSQQEAGVGNQTGPRAFTVA